LREFDDVVEAIDNANLSLLLAQHFDNVASAEEAIDEIGGCVLLVMQVACHHQRRLERKQPDGIQTKTTQMKKKQ
jgi:hypothetical protein